MRIKKLTIELQARLINKCSLSTKIASNFYFKYGYNTIEGLVSTYLSNNFPQILKEAKEKKFTQISLVDLKIFS